MALAAAGAIAPSLAALVWLALRDPKRLRSMRRHDKAATRARPHPRALRRLLTLVALLPGAALCIAGQWPAFLIWMGATISVGWLLVQILAPVSTRSSGHADRGDIAHR
jgi:hypothetical protein